MWPTTSAPARASQSVRPHPKWWAAGPMTNEASVTRPVEEATVLGRTEAPPGGQEVRNPIDQVVPVDDCQLHVHIPVGSDPVNSFGQTGRVEASGLACPPDPSIPPD